MLFNIDSLLQGLSRDSLAFLPELLVCCVIVLLLFLRLFPLLDRVHLGWIALVATIGILVVGWYQWNGRPACCSPRKRRLRSTTRSRPSST